MTSRLFWTIAAVAILIAPFSLVHADESLQQRYLGIYVKMHDSEILEKNGDYAGALKGFREIYAELVAIRNEDAYWESALVGHRLADCLITIQRLQKEVDAQLAKTSPGGTQSAATPSVPAPAIPSPDTPDLKTATPSKQKLVYPWKTGIYTTFFYIKDGETVFTSTSAPDGFSGKQAKKNGTDDPNDRDGFASGSHASGFNPFYVALPFNDLAFPEKAKKYVPAQWQRPPVDGKPVSACKDRWVEIKTEDGTGHICYAQWEDVGPLRQDHAEYVFGAERPDTYTRAGLDVSPGVAQYLGLIGQKHPLTSWRFVDDEDVPPGQWLKLDEQAVIYTAMHEGTPIASTVLSPANAIHAQPSSGAKLAPDSTKP